MWDAEGRLSCLRQKDGSKDFCWGRAFALLALAFFTHVYTTTTHFAIRAARLAPGVGVEVGLFVTCECMTAA